MRKSALTFIIGASLAGMALHTAPEAYALEELTDELIEETLNFEDDTSVEFDMAAAPDEPPPKPEPPYPGSEDVDLVQKLPPTPTPAPLKTEKPIRVNDEGEYFYSTKPEKPLAPSPPPGVETPVRADSEGQYYYDTSKDSPAPTNPLGSEKPTSKDSEGQYTYEVESSPLTRYASVRVAFFEPFDMKNPNNESITYNQVYGSANIPALIGDYEWPLFSSFGRLGIRLTSGLVVGQGEGKFLEAHPERRADDVPQEKFLFLMAPNQVTARLSLQFSETQYLVPYVEGGAGYFTFMEWRDDSKPPKLGGSPITVVAAGANFLLDWLDRGAVRQLDAGYGINHVWLTAEYRVMVGLKDDLDLTSNVISAGIAFDF